MREELLAEVTSTGDKLTRLLSSFTEEQMNTVPFEGSWTAAQVASHICKAGNCDILYGTTAPADRQPDEKTAMVKELFLNFNIKMTSPEWIIPDNGYLERAAMLGQVNATWNKLLDATQKVDLRELCTDFEVPGFGAFTRMEWIQFITIHTQRHIHQLEGIHAAIVKE